MTSKQQFDVLWKVGCKHAILAIIKNKGRPLSRKQLRRELEYSIKRGLVNHVLALSRIAKTSLKSCELEELVNRCLQLQWVPDALHAARQGVLFGKTRRRLIRAAIAKGLAASHREGAELLSSY